MIDQAKHPVAVKSFRLLAIQTGAVAALTIRRGDNDLATVMSGIRKRTASSLDQPTPVEVRRLGLAGDEQADLSIHGGLDKAVYAYPTAHYAFWQEWLQRPLEFGALGENLSVEGLLESDLWIGDELHFADCILVVESPRRPCFKLNALLGSELAAREMVTRGLTGCYLSVLQTGSLRAGESFVIQPGRRLVSLGERQKQMTRPADLR